MALIDPVQRTLDRRPKAKRRFNLLLEQAPASASMQKRMSVLAAFIFFGSILVAGIWQIRSGGDTVPAKRPVLGGFGQIREASASLPDPFSEMELPLHGPEPPPVSSAAKAEDALAEADPPVREEVKANLSGPSEDSPEEAVVRSASTKEAPKRRQTVRRSSKVRTKAQIFYKKAQAYHLQKNFEMATEMYLRTLKEKPGHRDALFHLSSIHMERSEYAEAYPLLTELVRLKPDDPQGLANLAVTEIALGRPGKAIILLDAALTLEDTPQFKVYLHQGVARSKLNKPDEAIAWYKKAEHLDPGHAHLLFNMAVTYDRIGRYHEALDCYARYLKADESSSPRERREVQTRIGLLMAYLVEEPKGSPAEGTHRPME